MGFIRYFNMGCYDYICDDKSTASVDKCCASPNICEISGMRTCTNCGNGDTDSILTISEFDDNFHKVYHLPYERVIYFKQKLNLINGRYQYVQNAKILFLINRIRKSGKRLSLYKLKLLLTKNGLNKYYKHIYSIYNDIYGFPIIKINQHIVNKMVHIFIQLERYFKKMQFRKNMISYNCIIYCLLKYFNVPGYDKLLLPYNKNKIKKIIMKMLADEKIV